jgi:hypothetical protein
MKKLWYPTKEGDKLFYLFLKNQNILIIVIFYTKKFSFFLSKIAYIISEIIYHQLLALKVLKTVLKKLKKTYFYWLQSWGFLILKIWFFRFNFAVNFIAVLCQSFCIVKQSQSTKKA